MKCGNPSCVLSDVEQIALGWGDGRILDVIADRIPGMF